MTEPSMKCDICKKDFGNSFYTYELEGGCIDLCDNCERELLMEMVSQFILENKVDIFARTAQLIDIDKRKVRKRKEKIKKMNELSSRKINKGTGME